MRNAILVPALTSLSSEGFRGAEASQIGLQVTCRCELVNCSNETQAKE